MFVVVRLVSARTRRPVGFRRLVTCVNFGDVVFVHSSSCSDCSAMIRSGQFLFVVAVVVAIILAIVTPEQVIGLPLNRFVKFLRQLRAVGNPDIRFFYRMQGMRNVPWCINAVLLLDFIILFSVQLQRLVLNIFRFLNSTNISKKNI